MNTAPAIIRRRDISYTHHDFSLFENYRYSAEIEVGDLVATAPHHLLGHFHLHREKPTGRTHLLTRQYRRKRLIYGTVKLREIDVDGNDFFTVEWAIRGLYAFGALVHTDQDVEYINSLRFYGYEIKVLKKWNNHRPSRNLYLRLFFLLSQMKGIW